MAQTYSLQPAASRVDNPLKGLVPYARSQPDRFPHSMEFQYVPLSDLMLEADQFDWQPMETLLNDIASRGNQAVVRIYTEYPGQENGIPEFLVRDGLKVHRYINTNTAPLPPAKVATPDYEDPKLQVALKSFIHAFGNRYDGDKRLAYITAGLLGTWGEWHTYPRNELWASETTQNVVIDAYEQAFGQTPVLLRYPAGPDHDSQAANANRPFGYHDDSFACATLPTDGQNDSWYYMPALIDAGPAAEQKWQTQPIGGEIRPEVWGKVFDAPDQWVDGTQDFGQCVSQTHATWLMDTGLFREPPSKSRRQNAQREVRRMGYDFYISQVRFEAADSMVAIQISVINQGVAPFYADWPTEIALVQNGVIQHRVIAPGLSLAGYLPGEHRLTETIATENCAGQLTLLIRVVNPLEGGKSLTFANASQDATLPGWLTLGDVQLP